ncbi:MAG TPA: response regulator transcription factor [Bryobacteraceae bacterium]|nr:response regulator transcription factor [Bryobacteraceae bacterium]
MPSALIVDDHMVVRRGLRHTLAGELRGMVFGEARNGDEALRAVAQRAWDIVILDIGVPGRDGFTILQEVLRHRPDGKVLMLSVHAEAAYAARAMRLGARGYISKSASLAQLVKAVRTVLGGEKYFSKLAAAVSRRNGDGGAADKPLSVRERQVLLAMGAGKSVGEIAGELGLNIRTVSTYKRRTLNKLQLDSTASLIRYIIDHDLS